MPAFVTFGRVLFAILFIYSGISKLLNIAATADFIASKLTIPDVLTPYTSQMETVVGMPTPQILAIAIGVLEVAAGLFIALNIAARFFAILMIVFVVIATIYARDFWTQWSMDSAK